MSEDGKKCQFAEPNWTTSQNFQMKITALMFSKAKAILFVPDPKSGFKSFSESSPGIAGYLSSSVNGTKVNPGADDDASGCAALLSTAEDPMTGPNGVFVITDNQSRELIDIANEIDKKSILKNLSW